MIPSSFIVHHSSSIIHRPSSIIAAASLLAHSSHFSNGGTTFQALNFLSPSLSFSNLSAAPTDDVTQYTTQEEG
jgi:hypothetical protein